MSDPLAVRPQNKLLGIATASGVGALAVGGFTLSFAALRELAQREFAIASELSFIYPLVVDGFIVIATAAAFTMKKRGPRVTWYPWAALAVFGALSVLGNAAHAIDNPSATFPAWISALGASVPAVALLIASHLLVMMIDGKSQTRPRVRSKVTVPVKAKEAPPVTAALPMVDAGDQSLEEPERRRLHAVDPVAEPKTLVEQVADIIASGESVTAGTIARIQGVSDRTGRRRLAELREQHPEIFETGREAAL